METPNPPGSRQRDSTLTPNMPRNGLVTSSWLKMWWLTRFQGYKVTNVRHVPKKGAFGRLKYDSMWFLDAKRNGRKTN